MLLGDLPDLRDTQSGKDLMRMGGDERARETLVDLLEAKFGKLSRKVRQRIKQTLLDVFVNWLEQRFKGKGTEGIQNMLLGELPDLRDTQSGKDLIRIGKIEGARETLVRQLEAKFGKLSAKVRQRIKKTASADRLDSLLLQVLTIESPDQLQW